MATLVAGRDRCKRTWLSFQCGCFKSKKKRESKLCLQSTYKQNDKTVTEGANGDAFKDSAVTPFRVAST